MYDGVHSCGRDVRVLREIPRLIHPIVAARERIVGYGLELHDVRFHGTL
jgi:hypothetical protein